MTQAEMHALLRELRELELAESVIAASPNLAETYTWVVVVHAIRERRAKLIKNAEARLSEMRSAPAPEKPAATYATWLDDEPPGRVH